MTFEERLDDLFVTRMFHKKQGGQPTPPVVPFRVLPDKGLSCRGVAQTNSRLTFNAIDRHGVIGRP